MYLSFLSRTPCPSCGFGLKNLFMAAFRVNKRSITQTGGALEFRQGFCPECRTPADVDPPPRERYAATTETTDQIRAYRLHRWPDLAKEAEAK